MVAQVNVITNLEGRLRLRVSEDMNDPKVVCEKLAKDKYVKRAEYNLITKTILIEYVKPKDGPERVIYAFCALYGQDIGANRVILNYTICKKCVIGYSAYLSLALIALDLFVGAISPATSTVATEAVAGAVGAAGGIANAATRGTAYRTALRWAAMGSTAGAIFEHGYKELNEKGAFDPEVMSIMYLVNQIGKQNNRFAPAIAWVLTFGRHLIRSSHDSIILSVLDRDGVVKAVPENHKKGYLNTFLNKCLDSYQKASVRV